MVLKILAFGLVANDLPDRKPYFMDWWNWLDFVVVLFALLANMNVLSSNITKIFRLFRVLRPLKSVKSLPAVAAIVSGMLNSLRDLSEILFTISFVFVFFSIVGLQLFIGPYLHTRCRLTPFPVNNSWVAKISEGYLNGSTSYKYTLNYTEYRCLNGPNFDHPSEHPSWEQSDSPWFVPQPNCYWPIDNSNQEVCSLSGSGTGRCSGWCGSNYDALGNPRFDASTASKDTYTADLGYGFVNFDNFAYAFLFVVQVFSGDSWSVLMYELTHAVDFSSGVIFCSLIVLFGTFFLLQLNVALLQKAFLKQKEGNPSGKKDKTINEARSSKRRVADKGDSKVDIRVHPFPDDMEEKTLSLPAPFKYKISSINFKEQTDHLIRKSSQLKDRTVKVFAFWQVQMRPGIFVFLETQIRRVDQPEKNAFRRICKSFYTNRFFEYFSMIVVIINTAMFAYTHDRMDPKVFAYINAAQYVITMYSLLESLVALAGLGLIEYFSNSYNAFDFVIVVLSAAASFVSPLPCLLSNRVCRSTHSSLNSLLSLRSFRCFTIFRLLKVNYFKDVLRRISKVVRSMLNFLVVLFLFVFLFALVGMQFFANRFHFDSEGYAIKTFNSPEWTYAPDKPRSSFDSFTLAFLTIFQIITIDNWSTVMFDCGRAIGPAGVILPVVVFVLGTFFITNLFLAMLVNNFLEGDDDAQPPEVQPSIVEEAFGNAEVRIPINDGAIRIGDDSDGTHNLDSDEISNGKSIAAKLLTSSSKTAQHIGSQILNHDLFEVGITILVCVSCISLALDSPLNDPNSLLDKRLYYIDLVVTVIFTVEMLLKIIVFGAFQKRTESEAYFRNGWDNLDFFVVVVSLLSTFSSDGKSIGVLRALRSLRPLKIIQRIPGLRVIVQSLILALPSVAEVSVIVFMVYFIFAIFYTNYFYGQLRACTLPFDITSQKFAPQNDLLVHPIPWDQYSNEQRSWFAPNNTYTTGNVTCSSWPSQPCCSSNHKLEDFKLTSKFLCDCWGGTWDPVTDFRFDNLAMSMLTLFGSATIDNWTDNMHLVSDSTGIDMQPIRDNQIWWYYIYLFFILVGNFVCIQLFVGVIVQSFEDCKGKVSGIIFVTAEQQDWIKTARVLQLISPKKKFEKSNDNLIRQFCFSVCESKPFQVFAITCIIAQVALLSIDSFGQPTSMTQQLGIANFILAILFVVEVLLKWTAYGVLTYLNDWWNFFELLIFIVSAVYVLLYFIGYNTYGTIEVFMSGVRLLRVAFLMRGIPMLKRFLDFMVLTIPAVGNITILVFFCIYIFTIIGVNLFAKVAYNKSYDSDTNFRSFGSGFVTLFRMTTADNWSQYMYDLSKKPPNCVDNPPYNGTFCGFNDSPNCLPLNGCGLTLSFPYWVIYVILMTLILLSVFISAIINRAEYDPHATCFISLDHLKDLVGNLFVPFGFGGKIFSQNQYMRRIGRVKITIRHNDYVVHFQDVIAALSIAHFERKVKWNKDISVARRLRSYGRGGIQIDFTVRHLSAAVVIQKHWHLHKSRGVLFKKRRTSMEPSERWKSFVAVSHLRIAPHIGVKMLPTGQVSLSSTWHRRQEEQGLPSDIDAKESLSDFGSMIGNDHSSETVISDPKMLMAMLVEEVPLDEDDVAVVVAPRRKKPSRRRHRDT
eukprot:gene25037-33549_t